MPLSIKILAATMIVNVAAAPSLEISPRQLSARQTEVAAEAYTRSATECVVHFVVEDARFQKSNPKTNLTELIVDSMPKCVGPMRAMIDAYDRYFGDGFGERYFTGPYLDALPDTVARLITSVRN